MTRSGCWVEELQLTFPGRGIQLTDEIEFEKACVEVDEAKAEEAMKEYTDVSK